MWGRISKLGRSGGLVPTLLAFVLLFRLLIPTGYMIAPDESGRPGLVLCAFTVGAAADPTRHGGGHDGHPAAPEPSKPGEIPCPHAALAAPPLPPAPPAFLPPIEVATEPPGLAQTDGLQSLALAAPPPPATGPPSSV
jgi:hypothetical protein